MKNQRLALGELKLLEVRQKAEALEEYFFRQKGSVIAYSGGVDSALLAWVAHKVLAKKMVAVIADSPSLARRELVEAKAFAERHAIPLKVIKTQEIDDPRYLANLGDRCYYCKKALFEKIEEIKQMTEAGGLPEDWPVFYGINLDDLNDLRPGQKAAKEFGILAPYLEVSVNKEEVRALCRYYELKISEKPAMACMASRIPVGDKVDVKKLQQVETAEDFLHSLGLEIFRVRHHGEVARIEVPKSEFSKVTDSHESIVKKFKSLGFLYVALELAGFKSGSLNASLVGEKG